MSLGISLAPSSVKMTETHRFRHLLLLSGRPLQTLKIINFGVMQGTHFKKFPKKNLLIEQKN